MNARMKAICVAAGFLFAASAVRAADTAPIEKITPPRSANEHILRNGYPEMSRKLYEEGVVTLKYTVGIDGKPHDIHVQHSSGYPRLDAAAMDEVGANWLYQPAMRNGEAIPVLLEANVRYKLHDDPPNDRHAAFRMTPEQFPAGAWNRSESGLTAVGIDLKSDGSVDNAAVLQSSGYDDLDKAALAMIGTIKFGAVTLNGTPMDCGITVLFVWPANPDAKPAQ